MLEKIFYLDHAAATPMDDRVFEAMKPYFSEKFFNPSSPYAPAVQVRRNYEDAKARLAATFGARADEVIMTAGATESINLAFATTSGHVVVSAIEHDAVLAAARRHSVTEVAVTNKGIITPEAVKKAITADTELVSVQLANNELGTIQPIRHIADVVAAERQRRRDAGDTKQILFHCDASQGFGQIDVHTARLGVDLLTLNAGKMYGPKQVGLLWVKAGIVPQPLIVGGGQERGVRSGTENVAGVIGFARAAELASNSRKSEAERLAELRDDMQKQLEGAIPELIVSGHLKKRLPGSLHVSIPGLDAERLIFALENRGVLLATGSACAANKGTRSHVLTAIGMSDQEADGSLRITLGRHSTKTDCMEAGEIIINEIKREQERLVRA
jgi:cysteine desulfurase